MLITDLLVQLEIKSDDSKNFPLSSFPMLMRLKGSRNAIELLEPTVDKFDRIKTACPRSHEAL